MAEVVKNMNNNMNAKLENIKNKCRLTAYIATLLFVITVLIIFLLAVFAQTPILLIRFVMILTIFPYFAMVSGYWGWFLMACIIGFYKQDILVMGKRGWGERYTGLAAKIWAVLGMLFALFLWMMSLLPIVAVLFPDL
ncbi:MAG: hypothetical protein QME05_02410 [Candidatus Margulisbacteria bacterium]|nr:hypothetical protein [Candidatus Margulisiibacteriota bacterium]